MRIEIVGRNYTPGEKLKNIITKKAEKLERFFDGEKPESKLSSFIEKDAVAKFVCSQEGNKEKYTLEATVYFGDRIVRAEETSSNMYDNVDFVIPKLERQVSKLRTKFSKKIKEESDLPFAEDIVLKPVRTKKFELVPMSIDAAIEELDLLDHDFYVYLNAETGMVNVVYKRVKGDVGVIECIY